MDQSLPDLSDPTLSADDVRRALDLAPHPEGGFYKETYRDRPADGARGSVSVIFFLLVSGVRLRWHRIDAAEMWLWHAGAHAQLMLGVDEARQTVRLGTRLQDGENMQAVVPPGVWQSAMSLGAWTLVSCVVAPAFEFSRFEIAPEGWQPPQRG